MTRIEHDTNPTTQTFARSLGERCRDATYADPIDRPEPSMFSPGFEAFCMVCGALLLILMFWTGMSLPVPW